MTAAEGSAPGAGDSREPRSGGGLWPLFALRQTRAAVRGWPRRLLTGAIALVVGLLALWVGGMLTVFPTQGIYTIEIIWWGPPSGWWFYPELLVVQPWGLLQLPWLPTLAMLLVSLAAGVGSTAAVGMLGAYWRNRRHGTQAAGGVAAGAGPGVVSLATLGACCCTTCTSTGSLALVAAVSGTSPGGLLELDWFLPVFQLAIVYVALLAQERSLVSSRRLALAPPTVDRRFAAGALLRLALLVGGITWSLAMLVEWGTADPLTASAATWYHWLFEHQLLGGLAIVAALLPGELAGAFRRGAHAVGTGAVRIALALAAITWGIGVPAPLASMGLGGLVNEVAAALSGSGLAGSAAGALAFHWVIQHGLLAAFALVFAVRPQWAMRPLLRTTARPWSPGSSGAADGGRPSTPGVSPSAALGPETASASSARPADGIG